MQNSFSSSLNIRWLTSTAVDEPSTLIAGVSEFKRQDYPWPAEIGQGYFERVHLALGVDIFRGVHRFQKSVSGRLIPLFEIKHEFPETTLVVQSVQGGVICHREDYPPPTVDLIYKPGHDFFRYADRISLIPLIDSSSNSEMTSLCIEGCALHGLIGEELSQHLLKGLGLTLPPVVKVIPMPLKISAPLRACVSSTMAGPLKKLFAQAKVLEYLSILSKHLHVKPASNKNAHRKRDAMHDLQNYLRQLEGRLPTLDQLAVRYGISAKWLNEAFTEEYGQSIYSFITDHRLNESHLALQEGNLPIKTISLRMGYSHVNNFTVAFKKKFGYPPGSLRVGRWNEEEVLPE